jgi:hypothetical protein
MSLEGIPPELLMTELLDRVLDKGIVVDAAVRVAVAGIHLVDLEMQVVVASIQTYLEHAETDWTGRWVAQRHVSLLGQPPVASDMLIAEVQGEAKTGREGEPPGAPVETR